MNRWIVLSVIAAAFVFRIWYSRQNPGERSSESGRVIEPSVFAIDPEAHRQSSGDHPATAEIEPAKPAGIDLHGDTIDPDTWVISGDFVAQSGIDERQVGRVNERLQGAMLALNDLESDHLRVIEQTDGKLHVAIDPFPEEGGELYRTLLSDLGAILGRDTAPMNAIQYALRRIGIEGRSDFGAQEGHIRIETLDSGGYKILVDSVPVGGVVIGAAGLPGAGVQQYSSSSSFDAIPPRYRHLFERPR